MGRSHAVEYFERKMAEKAFLLSNVAIGKSNTILMELLRNFERCL